MKSLFILIALFSGFHARAVPNSSHSNVYSVTDSIPIPHLPSTLKKMGTDTIHGKNRHLLLEVIVTGASDPEEIKKNSIPILFVNREFLERRVGSTNIMDALSQLPGVSVVTTGPNISKPFIHGLGYNRVLTLVDGVRHEEQQWGDEHAVQVDQNSIDYAEVIKGPLSLIYGPDALAGVISLHSPLSVPEGKIWGSASSFYKSNSGLWGESLKISSNNRGWVWSGIFSAKRAKNYQNPMDGRVWNTGYFEKDGKIRVGILRPWGYTYLTGSIYDDQQQVPDGSRDSITRRFTKQISEADTLRPLVTNKELNAYSIPVLHQHISYYQVYNNSRFRWGKDTFPPI